MDKFSENLPTEQSECEAQFTLKNQPLPNLKAVERVRTQSTFKNYPYDPSSFEQVRTQSTFNNYPYHQFRTTLFKLLRNYRISRCAIYFERLSAKDYSNCITPLRGKKRSVVRAKAIGIFDYMNLWVVEQSYTSSKRTFHTKPRNMDLVKEPYPTHVFTILLM